MEEKMEMMIKSLEIAIANFEKATHSSFECYSALEQFRKIANPHNIKELIQDFKKHLKDRE